MLVWVHVQANIWLAWDSSKSWCHPVSAVTHSLLHSGTGTPSRVWQVRWLTNLIKQYFTIASHTTLFLVFMHIKACHVVLGSLLTATVRLWLKDCTVPIFQKYLFLKNANHLPTLSLSERRWPVVHRTLCFHYRECNFDPCQEPDPHTCLWCGVKNKWNKEIKPKINRVGIFLLVRSCLHCWWLLIDRCAPAADKVTVFKDKSEVGSITDSSFHEWFSNVKVMRFDSILHHRWACMAWGYKERDTT